MSHITGGHHPRASDRTEPASGPITPSGAGSANELRRPRDEHDQQLPVPHRTNVPDSHDLLVETIYERKALGERRYGSALQPRNGRDNLVDALQEAADLAAYLQNEVWQRENHPTIVTLCGSTRFRAMFDVEMKRLTLLGFIVIGPGLWGHAGDLPAGWETSEVKSKLDELHLRKIDMSDAIHVINVDDYVGPSTRREIEYASKLGKDITYLELPALWFGEDPT
jgi:hypothetical protein